MPRQGFRIATRAIVTIAAVPLAYLLAGAIGGAIPANRGWTPPARGITIWVETNGIHTGIIVPKAAAGLDWRPVLPARDLADPRYGAHDHAAFGWGDRAFYLETPTWADVRPATILAAAIGSERTLLHVDHVARPRPGDGARAIVLRPEEYRRLTRYIRATLAERPTARHGYFGYDVFYTARGRYSAVRTCNAWTGDALRHAGVRIGAWTPFAGSVMAWFDA